MLSRSRHLFITSAVAFALALLLVVPAGGAAAADGEEATLCDALPVEELNALSDLRFAEPAFGGPELCAVEAAAGQSGPHSLFVNHREGPFGMDVDDFVASLEEQGTVVERIDLDGRAGYIDTSMQGAVIVGVQTDERILTVTADVADSAEAGELDPVAFTRDVASLVLANLDVAGGDDTSAGGGTDGSDAESGAAAPGPPAVDGIEWRVAREWDGARIEAEAVPVETELWERLLAAAGASFADASLAEHVAQDAASGEDLGTYGAWRVAGADPQRLVAVAVAFIAELAGDDDFSGELLSLGGREVTAVIIEGETLGYLYGAGQTLYQLEMPEAVAERVLRELE